MDGFRDLMLRMKPLLKIGIIFTPRKAARVILTFAVFFYRRMGKVILSF